ncbi:MAG: 2-hydroxy-3-oxopropionate reductase [Actinomycetales bacterium]|nr:2-hydroxy-3-oxopropionate reductase [Actinomycetales bacterium]
MSEVPTVGFIGLGIMGMPMSVNLARAGYPVIAYSRSGARSSDLVDAGGQVVPVLSDALQGADVVITMLPDSPEVLEVTLGSGGVLESCQPGTVLVDMSTIAPDTSRQVFAQLRTRGIPSLDAPVSGGEVGAIAGTLSIMVGGDAAVLERVRPILDVLGGTVVHVGGPGSGQVVKAANQLIVAGTIQLVAEALTLASRHGVDPAAAAKVMGGGLAASRVLELKAKPMIEGAYPPGFRCRLHNKDLGIIIAAARDVGAAIPMGLLVSQFMASLVATGRGDLDHSALHSLVVELSAPPRPSDDGGDG